MTYVGRAITPWYYSRRFDARYFLADGSLATFVPIEQEVIELEERDWYPVDKLHTLPMPEITRCILNVAIQCWNGGNIRPPFRKIEYHNI